jgi:hypothetical protein
MRCTFMSWLLHYDTVQSGRWIPTEDRSSVFLRNIGTYKTTRCHNPEHHNINENNIKAQQICTLTRKQTGRQRKSGWTAGRRFFCSPRHPDRIWGPPASYARGLSGRGVKTTTQLHLMPMLIMSGAVPPLPIRLHDMVLT